MRQTRKKPSFFIVIHLLRYFDEKGLLHTCSSLPRFNKEGNIRYGSEEKRIVATAYCRTPNEAYKVELRLKRMLARDGFF
jgi:hypothetical protein